MRKLLLIFLFAINICAGQPYTIRQALDTALQNNLGIRIAKNNAIIAVNNFSAGEAGLLPAVDVNAGTSAAAYDIHQKLRSGETFSYNNVKSGNTNASVALSWTIFDGFKMFASYERLKVLEQAGELQVSAQVTGILAATARSYYDLQRQQLLVKFSQGTLTLYRDRMRIAQKKLEIGSSPRTEFLQASLDYNAQLSLLRSRLADLQTAQAELNSLLLKPVPDSIYASDSLTVPVMLNFTDLQGRMEQGNLDIREQLLLQDISNAELCEAKGTAYPVIDVNAAYGYTNSTTQQGFLLENRNIGPSAGITFKWNIFNGFITGRQLRNYKLTKENASLSYMQVLNDAHTSLLKNWISYQSALDIYNRELQNVTLADQNLSIATERYKLNEGTVLDLREAQKASEDVQSRLADAYYQLKIASTSLMVLTGKVME